MNKTNRANSFIFENKSGTHTPISEMSGQPLHEASSRLNLFGKNEVIPLKNKALMQKKGKEKKKDNEKQREGKPRDNSICSVTKLILDLPDNV